MAQMLKKAGEIGLLGGGIPEEYGGSGLDKVSATVLAEKLAGYAFVCACRTAAHAGIGTVPIVYFGTEEQKKKYLPKIASGELLSCYCLSEPQAGSDALALATRAVLSPDGKNWILNGQKMWITNGGFADVYIVFAKVDGEKFSCFIVERGTPGFSRRRRRKKNGHQAAARRCRSFSRMRPFPRKICCTKSGRGHIVAFNTLNVGRFSLGAYCLGGAKKVLDSLLEIFKGAHGLRQVACEFGLIKAKLGEMAIRIFAIESMVYRTAGMIEAAVSNVPARSGQDQAGHAACSRNTRSKARSAKWGAARCWTTASTKRVQIFGGYGFHEDYPVARAYRDSRINRIFEGTNEINRMLIVQMLMKRAMAGVAAADSGGDEAGGRSSRRAVVRRTGRPANSPKKSGRSHRRRKSSCWRPARRCRNSAIKLAEQQEIVASLANIVMDVYAMESTLRRAQKAHAARGAAASVMADAARAFIYDAMDRIEKEARTALIATPKRRHAHNATRRPAAIREARAHRHDRHPPPRCRCRAGAGSLSVRRAVKRDSEQATSPSAGEQSSATFFAHIPRHLFAFRLERVFGYCRSDEKRRRKMATCIDLRVRRRSVRRETYFRSDLRLNFESLQSFSYQSFTITPFGPLRASNGAYASEGHESQFRICESQFRRSCAEGENPQRNADSRYGIFRFANLLRP